MIFTYLASLLASKEKPQIDKFLRLLWLSHRVEWVINLCEQLVSIEPKVHILFLQQLTENHVTKYTSEIIRQLLIKYPKPEHNVCLEVSKMLKEDTFIGAACAVAIGSEKNTSWNKEFYHKIRTLKQLEIGPWRKYLNSVKEKINELCPILETKSVEYTLGLFNEPLSNSTKNTSSTNEILSLYNGRMFRNKHMRTCVEIALDLPLKQSDFHMFAEHMGDEPLVIITKNLDEKITVPKNMYVVFIDSTKSFGERIFPYVEIISTWNLFDHM